MVYGLNVKPAHGYYVDVEALDGDLPLNRDYSFAAGRAVVPDHMPTRMRWGDRHGPTQANLSSDRRSMLVGSVQMPTTAPPGTGSPSPRERLR